MNDATEIVAAQARAAGKNIGADARELGVVPAAAPVADREPAAAALAARALELLREEVQRMRELRETLVAERQAGAPGRPSPRLDAMAASVEGAARFALRMGLLTPGEARQVFAEITIPPGPAQDPSAERGPHD